MQRAPGDDASPGIRSEADINEARKAGRTETAIGRQILKDHVRMAKEKQYSEAFDKEKEGLKKEGDDVLQEAEANVARAQDAQAQAAQQTAGMSPEELENLRKRGMDPMETSKKALTEAEALKKKVKDKIKAEGEMMDNKKPLLMKDAREQAVRESGEDIANIPVKSPEEILRAVEADRQAQFLDSVTPQSLQMAEVELSGIFSGVLSSIITNMLTKKPNLVRKHLNVQYQPARTFGKKEL